MSDDHCRPCAQLAITDLERAADECRTMAATTSTASDRDSHIRVADQFERIVERRKASVENTFSVKNCRMRGGIHGRQLVRRR